VEFESCDTPTATQVPLPTQEIDVPELIAPSALTPGTVMALPQASLDSITTKAFSSFEELV
jgi:hypothetical protein